MGAVVDDHKDFVAAAEAQNCSDPECTDPLHAHHHSRDDHLNDMQPNNEMHCTDPNCSDTSHSHWHNHSSDVATHGDPDDCTDTSHSHLHSHSSDVVTHAGIGALVFRARRPFHPSRIISVLQKLPIVRGVPSGQGGDNSDTDDSAKKTFQRVLRSKGFCWNADSNVKALYWSHVGCSFEMQCLGRWWATLPKQLVSNI